MATSNELVFGRFGSDHDALLSRCHSLMPSWLWPDSDTHPVAIIARLIWLDQQRGVDSSDNVVYMAPEVADHLLYCVEILDKKLKRIINARDESVKASNRVTAIQRHGFEVKFIFPGRANMPYPDWIHGQVRTIRVLTPDQLVELPYIFTAKQDGGRLGE